MRSKFIFLTLLVATLAGPLVRAGIFIQQSEDTSAVLDPGQSVDLPSVSAQINDIIVVAVGTNKKESAAPLTLSKVGGSGSAGTATLVKPAGDPYPTSWVWYQTVTGAGDFTYRVSVSTNTNRLILGIYVIRADSGSIELAGSATWSDVDGDSNPASHTLDYTFGETLTDGILIEAVSARQDTISTVPGGYVEVTSGHTSRSVFSYESLTGSTWSSAYGLTGGTVGALTSSGAGVIFKEAILVDLPPSFSSDPVLAGNAVVGVPYSESLAGNASDPNGDPLTFTKTGGPGWLIIGSDGSLSGTPSLGHLGLNTFSVEVADPGSNSATADLQVTVVEGLAIPVQESFETFAVFSTTHSEAGWSADEADAAQIRPVSYSYPDLPITGLGHEQVLDVKGPLTANFSTPLAHQEVLLDTMLQVMRRTDPAPPASDAGAQCAFFFDQDGHLVVRHAVYTGNFTAVSQQWTPLSNTPVASDQWVRLKVLTDYNSDGRGDAFFTVELDGVTLTSPEAYTQLFPTDEVSHMGGSLFLCANSGLGTGSDGLTGLSLAGQMRIDDLTVTTPASVTADGTPYDWIEDHYPGADWDAVAVLDLDGDGMTTDQEYRAGTNPNDPNSVLRLELSWLANGDVQLNWPDSLQGALTPYSIQRSTDLSGWTTIATGILRNLDGAQEWMETPPADSRLFYRLTY